MDQKLSSRLNVNKNTKFWVWLTLCLGFGTPKIKAIYKNFKDLEEFYTLGENNWRMCAFLNEKDIQKLISVPVEKAEEIIFKTFELGYQVITIEDDNYPKALKEIYAPPAVLYVSGNLFNINKNLLVSMVGTRDATPDGMKSAFDISYGLSKAGITIVSGGALGIDTAAHKGALQAGGKTICVLGCGINYNYLMTNAKLRSLISNYGAVISEYPLGTPAARYNFPTRNRIIAGLSSGTVVVEAGEKSGSLITARLALEQNRDVFAVPGGINSRTSQGTNSLIKQGAYVVTTYMDIIDEYKEQFKLTLNNEDNNEISFNVDDLVKQGKKREKTGKIAEKQNNEKLTNDELSKMGLSDEAVMIYNLLTIKPKYKDEIIASAGILSHKVFAALTQLEIKGLIRAFPGSRYGLSQN